MFIVVLFEYIQGLPIQTYYNKLSTYNEARADYNTMLSGTADDFDFNDILLYDPDGDFVDGLTPDQIYADVAPGNEPNISVSMYTSTVLKKLSLLKY